MLVQDYLLNSAKLHSDKDCIIQAGRRSTYTEILSSSLSVADWLLSNKLQSGFRAAILTDEPSEYVSCYFGILTAGGTVVGLNTQTSGRTLKKILNDCGVSVIFVHNKFVRYLKEISSFISSVKVAAISGLNYDVVDDLFFDCIGYQNIISSYGKHDMKSFSKKNLN